ncbi:MAG: Mut7-C RNAse domain-containing protein [Xanthomonadales bacterium]
MTDDERHVRPQRHASFRFYAELNDFLPEARRQARFTYSFSGTPALRDAIQALGVPHTAIDLVVVDGRSVDFSHRLRGGEQVAVYPVFERLDIGPVTRLRPAPLRRTRFVLDESLGKLARYLRMFGFDTLWLPDCSDRDLIDRALAEGRIILTRDVDLLKHRRVTHGYWLRHVHAEEQLEEVLLALDLLGQQRPFSRCMACNGELAPVADKARLTEIDPDILARFETFHRCRDCGRIYWPGSHFDRMRSFSRNVASRALLHGLRAPGAYPHAVRSIQVVETHSSWVILTGDYAYKLKKPVALGFLDFSTRALRRACCEEEVRVNRRTAPSIYLGVKPVGAAAHGPRIGVRPALDYVVAMRQFPHEARLDRRIERAPFGAAEEEALAQAIADFHAGLAAVPTVADEPERTVRPARNNFRHLDPADVSDRFAQKLAVIEGWTLQEAESRAAAIRRRAAAGHVRDCHGDLHLENIVCLDGRFVPFDAIEFNPELRRIDTANDIAFLVMDLLARGRPDSAYGVFGAWLERTGDYDSLCVMRFYLVYRAMVRAVVSAIREAQSGPWETDSAPGAEAGHEPSFRPGPERYIALAAELVDTPPPMLILMHGLSGSGKTWTSNRLLRELPGVRVRSDLERKRLAGLMGAARAGAAGIDAGLYAPEVSARTYDILAGACATGLEAGFTMIADAAFLRRKDRRRFIELAAQCGARVGIVACEADTATLQRRIRRRMGEGRDASDADIAVLEHQLVAREPLDAGEQRLVLHPGEGPAFESLSS